ncbi:MAG: gamma-glutamyltransferase [Elainellaceae cyanobacterium]
MAKKTRGAIAAGHPQTVEAGVEMFRLGGNVFDATVAAMLASFVAEPALTSIAGGGFLLSHTADGTDTLFDFFSQTPHHRRPLDDVDFYSVDVDFGPAVQQFHVGLGAIATPGTIAGVFRVHDRLGRLPFKEVVAPAIHLAKTGAEVNDFQAYCFSILRPILLKSEEMRSVLAPDGKLVKSGDRTIMPNLANTLEYLAEEGVDAFYAGEIGKRLVQDCQDHGGFLTRDDLMHYRVIEREPLCTFYRDDVLLTNPPPSSGGALIAFTLSLLNRMDVEAVGFGSASHLRVLAQAMRLTNQARTNSFDRRVYAPDILENFLADEHIDYYQEQLQALCNAGSLNKWGSTTHISAIDDEGNAASVTASNGEGSSYVIPGTGIMTNNMLGEADLHPMGFHQWRENMRISSMMAPTIVLRDGVPEIVLGSGGSNRIRTAILQVISNLLDFQMPVDAAVKAPRMHWENGVFNWEPGFDAESIHQETEAGTFPFDETLKPWITENMFFGGVHAVVKTSDGSFSGAGDRRRGGAIAISG